MAKVGPTVKERVLALLLEQNEPMSIQTIAYRLNSTYGTVRDILTKKWIVQVGELPKTGAFQQAGIPLVVHPDKADRYPKWQNQRTSRRPRPREIQPAKGAA